MSKIFTLSRFKSFDIWYNVLYQFSIVLSYSSLIVGGINIQRLEGLVWTNFFRNTMLLTFDSRYFLNQKHDIS